VSVTHPLLSTPASTLYFVGWVEPRPKHRFAAFLRLVDDQPDAYDRLRLADPVRRAELARGLATYLAGLNWRELEEAVSGPHGVSAPHVIAYAELPVVLWPDEMTLMKMEAPGGGTGGGAA
jgi:hypothetical protein